jgi:hypothetical protein
LQKLTPLVRKIVIEQKRKKKVLATRDLRRLRPQLNAEVKKLKAYASAVGACT